MIVSPFRFNIKLSWIFSLLILTKYFVFYNILSFKSLFISQNLKINIPLRSLMEKTHDIFILNLKGVTIVSAQVWDLLLFCNTSRDGSVFNP